MKDLELSYFFGIMVFRTEKKRQLFYRNQETSESNKILSKKSKTKLFGHLSGDVCQERKTSAERSVLLR